MEVYRDYRRIEGYPNYVVSNYGEVFNVKRGKMLSPGVNTTGYYTVSLWKNNKGKTHKNHKLVATNFIDNPENKTCVDYIDNDKLNNHISNLRYATKGENAFNTGVNAINTSGHKGVYWDKRDNKWRAQIKHNYKNYFIGYFTNKEDAIKARREKALELYGAYTNACEKDDDE